MKVIFDDQREPWPSLPPPSRPGGQWAEAEDLIVRAQHRLHCDPESHALVTMAAHVAEVEFYRLYPELEPPVGVLRLAAAVALLLASEKTGGVGVDQEQRSDPNE